MQERIRSAVLLLILFLGLSFASPAAAFQGGQPGISRHWESPLDGCQKTFAEALRFREKENDYAAEKARYQESTARSCVGQRWYDLGLLDCLFFVPVVGLFLPLLGITIVGTLRSMWKSSSSRSIGKEADLTDAG